MDVKASPVATRKNVGWEELREIGDGKVGSCLFKSALWDHKQTG
jgi:hypothetical protein